MNDQEKQTNDMALAEWVKPELLIMDADDAETANSSTTDAAVLS